MTLSLRQRITRRYTLLTVEREALEVTALGLDEIKEAYLEAAKGVTGRDIIEVWLNTPRYFANLTGRGAPNVMLGPNRAGRFLFVPIAPVDRAGTWRVITAYWLNRARALRLYGDE
jgi:hypothetical protein